MRYKYEPQDVCPTEIEFDIEGDTVRNIVFTGGCDGNLKAIAKITDGMKPHQIEQLFKGNTCGESATSCADQLARAVRISYDAQNNPVPLS